MQKLYSQGVPPSGVDIPQAQTPPDDINVKSSKDDDNEID
jgi:hypothetical protein